MEKFYSPGSLLGIGLSFRDNAMISVILSHFPTFPHTIDPQYAEVARHQEHRV